jgi:hypothetical protein
MKKIGPLGHKKSRQLGLMKTTIKVPFYYGYIKNI